MSAQSFVCPYCQTAHTTLRAILSCHPRELRAMTAELEAGYTGVSHVALLGGDCPATLWQRTHARLESEVTASAEAA